MATAKKLPSGSWRCLSYDYTDEKGKRHYKSFTAPTKKQAEYLAAQYAMSDRKTQRTCMTLGDAVDAYIASREAVLSPSTIPAYMSIRKNRLQSIMGVNLDDLTNADIQKAINADVRGGLSPKSLKNAHGLLSATLKAYRPDFVLSTKLPERKRPDLVIPEDADVAALIEAARGTDLELPILLAAFGPMRRGEICALEARDIKGNVVHVCRNMVLDKNREWIVKTPKSYAGDRYIDYPDFVAEKWKGRKGRVVGLTPGMVSDQFQKAVKRAGLPGIRFHDLRHYSASIQHAMGIPDAYIMQRGGWTSDGTLKNIYRHALSDQQKAMAAKANTYFEGVYCDATRNATRPSEKP